RAVLLVHLVEVDDVRLQPAERVLAGAEDVLPGQAGVVGADRAAPEPDGEAALRREEDAVALAGDPRAGQLLAAALAVHVGGVDEVHPAVDRAVDHASRLVVARGDALHERLGLTEGHGPEAHDRDLQAAPAELTQLHVALISPVA